MKIKRNLVTLRKIKQLPEAGGGRRVFATGCKNEALLTLLLGRLVCRTVREEFLVDLSKY